MERDIRTYRGRLNKNYPKLPRRTVVLNVRYDTCKFCLNFAVSICISETYFGLPIFRRKREAKKNNYRAFAVVARSQERIQRQRIVATRARSLINLPVGKDKDKAAAGSIALRSGQKGETERKRKTVPNRRREFRNYCLSSTQLSPSLTFPYLRNNSRRGEGKKREGMQQQGVRKERCGEYREINVWGNAHSSSIKVFL